MQKKIVFLTGTRADFGKIKSLIHAIDTHPNFTPYVFVTGMHLQTLYGYTLLEVQREGFTHIHTFENHTHETTMDLTLAKTIEGLSAYVKNIQPDLMVIHGDRVEALAGAIVGSLNNILVAHIEGGELSGTIDELIRHATSKMSHWHFVANEMAKKRLIQMGELEETIAIIGSPDIDVMQSVNLPDIKTVKTYYEIPFDQYGVVLFHPVTTEVQNMSIYAQQLVAALIQSKQSYVVIYPNNDLGSQTVLQAFDILQSNTNFRIIPSLRFEYFLTLLKHAAFLIGNSSAGVREAPYYGVPTINIGTRQHNRTNNPNILHVGYGVEEIIDAIQQAKDYKKRIVPIQEYGYGNSTQLFVDVLTQEAFWQLQPQKQFQDL